MYAKGIGSSIVEAWGEVMFHCRSYTQATQEEKWIVNKCSKMAHFHQPIVLVKDIEAYGKKKPYQKFYTSSCNIACVNALNDCTVAFT